MSSENAQNQDDSPTLADIEAFEELLRSGCFDALSYTPQMRRSCSGWLQARAKEFSIWIRGYRASGPELSKPLLEMRENLVGLHEQLDMLCDGTESYLTVGQIEFGESARGAFDEFTGAWDQLRLSILPRYHLFANAYDTAITAGRPIDPQAIAVDPSAVQKELMNTLAVMQKALNKLAQELQRSFYGTGRAEARRNGGTDLR